jgi:hypothetical protein|tara:strand:- start:769 stop:1503 length:735 start_codon:yes stop_codon:yes gene_type:complete
MKNMKILLISTLFFVACEDSSSSQSQSMPIADMTPPTISFMSPSHNEIIEGSQTVSVMAQDNNKVEEVDIYIKGPTSSEYTSVASWRNLTSPYANYSYSWDTELEDNGQYSIKAIANDHNSYLVNGNAGATEEIVVNIYNQEEDSGDSGGGAVNGYIAVKNISHNKIIGGVYGSQTRYRKVQYASGEGLNECGCMACNPNNQYDFIELYYKPTTRSIKYKKAGDNDYLYATIAADRHCIRYTEE